MISPQAKRSLDDMLIRGIRTALPSPAGDATNIETADDFESANATLSVVMTICSLRFRALVMLHLRDDADTRRYFASVNRVDFSDFDDRSFRDAVGECANIFVGSMNRDLAPVFTHVGMSTPNIIDKDCARFLSKLGETHLQNFAISVPEGPSMQATLCVNAFEEIDFDLQTQTQEAEASGELEMF